jgi:hypothetical protein
LFDTGQAFISIVVSAGGQSKLLKYGQADADGLADNVASIVLEAEGLVVELEMETLVGSVAAEEETTEEPLSVAASLHTSR